MDTALASFAQQVGAGPHKQIVLVLDGAGGAELQALDFTQRAASRGVTPLLLRIELQPAERLWRLADDPLANRYFDSLDELENIVEARC